ncbi:MAG: translation initiation factor IF-2 [Acidobacteriota bacterium]
MEQIKVSELASEFEIQTSLVISELKKIGVWVVSADTPVDSDIANRIRRRLQIIVEMEQEDHSKTDRTKEKKKSVASRSRKSIKELGKPRKKAVAEEEKKLEEKPLAPSMKPRKGKASYRRFEDTPELAPEKTDVRIEDEPVIDKVEAQIPAEVLEKAMQQLAPEELKDGAQAPASPQEAEAAQAEPVQAGEPVEAQARAPVVEKPKPGVQAPPPVREKPRVIKTTSPGPGRVEPSPLKGYPSRRLEKPAARQEPKKPLVPPRPSEPPKRKEAAEAPRPAAEPVRPGFAEVQEIVLPDSVSIKELSEKLQVKSKDVLKELFKRGIIANINQTLDQKVVEEICQVFNAIPKFVTYEESVIQEGQVADRPEDLTRRAPVVTVMGHVDHGKTSLLDSIRQTQVAEGEAGGITQHIGAYHVEIGESRIVFLDTPGHEAFTLMRARGAQATDIVVLVVAAEDGVMPQTKEAIDHARAAGVPIIVAINKIDKPDAQPQRVKQELTEHELVAEDWGGDTVMVEVSAKEKVNLELLLEMILLVADMLDLKANPARAASGVILEAKLDKGRGAVATVLVQNGTLRIGDSFIAGAAYGKIRAMFDDRGEPITEAGPSYALEVLGFQGLPQAGDNFQVVDDTIKARQIGEYRQEKLKQQEMSKSSRVSLDDLYAQMAAGEVKELPVVLKGDAQGSVEVVAETLRKIGTDKVKINIIHNGVGAISESDVLLASASNAIVIGFNVRPEPNAESLAEREEVDVRLYTVIYDITDEIKKAMVGLLEPTVRESYLGRAEVRNTFKVPRFGTIAGSYVLDGAIQRKAEVRLLRDNVVVYEGRIESLRRFKDDVNEVKSGYECGISIANFNDIKVGDVMEAFVKEEVAPELT